MELKYPVMITLRKIRNAHPCENGWKKVLAANGGTKADFDAEFELASIIDSNGLNDCLWALQCKPEYQHVYRKFAVVCADEVSQLMTDDRSKTALDVSWSHSCGEVTDEQLAAARDAARAAAWAAARDAAWDAARDAAWDAARAAAWDAARAAARDAARVAAWVAAWDAARVAARDAARDAAWDAAWDAARAAAWAAAWDAAWDAARAAAWAAARDAAWDAARAAAWAAARDAALDYQTKILRQALTTGEVIRKCQKK